MAVYFKSYVILIPKLILKTPYTKINYYIILIILYTLYFKIICMSLTTL